MEQIYHGNFWMTGIDDRYILALFHHKLLDQQKCHKLMLSWYAHGESQVLVGGFQDKHIHKHSFI